MICFTKSAKTGSKVRWFLIRFCYVFFFIAFVEFLIHVNKFCGYKNSYLRSSFKHFKLVLEIFNYLLPILSAGLIS